MKKMALIMAMAALVCWLPGQAFADSITYYLVTTGDSTLPTESNYGTVTVNLVNSDQATVTFQLNAGLVFPEATYNFPNGYVPTSLYLNATGNGTPADTITPADWNSQNVTPGTLNGSATADSSWFFSGSAYTTSTTETGAVVTLNNNEGLWSSASQVLAASGSPYNGNYAAVEVDVAADPSEIGYVEVGAYTPVVPLPSTALLLGSGLLGMALLGSRRKRGTAFQL
ncbi:MAG: hypothetical protein WBQ36_05015 [Desulfobaccales bacterium]